MSSILNGLVELAKSTGIYGFLQSGGWGNAVMILVGFFLFYLAIKKGFEPLLLQPAPAHLHPRKIGQNLLPVLGGDAEGHLKAGKAGAVQGLGQIPALGGAPHQEQFHACPL